MGTSQTGSARPGHAQGETRHLPRGQKNLLIIYNTSTQQCFQAKKLFQVVSSRQTWTHHIGAEGREIFRKLSLIQSLLNFTLFLLGFQKRIWGVLCNVLLCWSLIFGFHACNDGMWIKVKKATDTEDGCFSLWDCFQDIFYMYKKANQYAKTIAISKTHFNDSLRNILRSCFITFVHWSHLWNTNPLAHKLHWRVWSPESHVISFLLQEMLPTV